MSDDIERFPTEAGGFMEQRKPSWDAIQAYHDRQMGLRRQEADKARLRTLFAQPGVEYLPVKEDDDAEEQKPEPPKFSRSERRKFAKCKHKRIKKTEHMDKVSLSCQDCGYTVSRDVTNFDRA